MNKLVTGGLITAVAVTAAALGAGLAAAAEPAPAPLPVPVVYQPVDATDGLFGIRRGDLPAITTPDLTGAGLLPGVQLDALPTPEAAPTAETQPTPQPRPTGR